MRKDIHFNNSINELLESSKIDHIIKKINDLILTKKENSKLDFINSFKEYISELVTESYNDNTLKELLESDKSTSAEYLKILDYSGDKNFYDFIEFLLDNKVNVNFILNDKMEIISDTEFLSKLTEKFYYDKTFKDLYSSYIRRNEYELLMVKAHKNKKENIIIEKILKSFPDMVSIISYRELEELLSFLVGWEKDYSENMISLLDKYQINTENYVGLQRLSSFISELKEPNKSGALKMKEYLKEIPPGSLKSFIDRIGLYNFEDFFKVLGLEKMIQISKPYEKLTLITYLQKLGNPSYILRFLDLANHKTITYFLASRKEDTFYKILKDPEKRRNVYENLRNKNYKGIKKLYLENRLKKT